jgi:DNA polymerase/3'-5' exonuclease PolX
MSTGRKVPLSEARGISQKIIRALEPFTNRLEVAGSIRRRRTWVRDIEIVAEPEKRVGDLFGTLESDVDGIRQTLKGLGTWEKGGDRFMQVRNVLGSGLTLDLFLVIPPAQWGSILAIRTGPAALGRECVTRMKRQALKHEGGRVVDLGSGHTLPTPTEREFFELAGVPFMEPQYRDTQAQRLEMEGGRHGQA